MRKEKACKVCKKVASKNKSLLIQYCIPTGYEYAGDEDEPTELEEVLIREYVCCEKCLKERMKVVYNEYQTSINVRYPCRTIVDICK